MQRSTKEAVARSRYDATSIGIRREDGSSRQRISGLADFCGAEAGVWEG